MNPPDTFCSRCGTRHTAAAYPKVCAACKATTWVNPKPVPVAICPVEEGVLIGYRGIPPHVGKPALFGGFHVCGEDWRTAAAREVQEETGQVYDPRDVRVLAPNEEWDPVFSTPNDNLLLFVVLPRIMRRDLVQGYVNEECLGTEVVSEPIDLAFPAHTEALRLFLERDTGRHLPWESWGYLEGDDLAAQSRTTLQRRARQQFGRVRFGRPRSDEVIVSPDASGRFEVFFRSPGPDCATGDGHR